MILIIIKQTGYDALSMNIVEQLIREVTYESGIHGPHWVMTEYTKKLSSMNTWLDGVQEGSGSSIQMVHMLEKHMEEINNGLYIKYPKGRFIHNTESFTNDWSRITTETAILKVVFPQLGRDTVWLLAAQHPFP